MRATSANSGRGCMDGDPALDFNVSADYYAKLKAGPASLRATLYVTLYETVKVFLSVASA